ncbi:MAG TPA: hypothetical protein VK843_09205 [Planctomycetota bacterium]|nr:hypothetical protein [Planctomycetota bacterium]
MAMRRGSIFASAVLVALAVLAAWWFLAREETSAVVVDARPSVEPLAPESPLIAPPSDTSEAREASAADMTAAVEAPKPELPAGMREVELSVVDPEMKPVPGARVEILLGGEGTLLTDAKGQCRFRADPSVYMLKLELSCEGFAHWRPLLPNQPSVRAVLQPALTLSGRVLDAQTKLPLPEASLYFPHQRCNGCPPTIVVTDPDGAYEATGLSSKQTTVQIRAKGYPSYSSNLELATSAKSVQRDFLIPPGLPLHGRVVDFTSGAPLAGAKVKAGGNWLTATSCVSDARGEFDTQVESNLESQISVTVECEGRCRLIASLSREDLADPAKLEFKLPASPIVEGFLLEESGAPMAGVSAVVGLNWEGQSKAKASGTPPSPSPLSALPASWRFEPSAFLAPTDDTGAFRMTGLVPWSPHYSVRYQSADFEANKLDLDPLPGPGESVHVELRVKRRRVETGNSVHGQVWLNGEFVFHVVEWNAGAQSGKTRTELHEEYRFEKLPAGSVQLHASVQGISAALEGDSVSVELHEGETLRHDFELRVPTGTIRGRAKFVGGGPAAGAGVRAWRSISEPKTMFMTGPEVSTAADGSFTLELPRFDQGYHISAKLGAASASRDDVALGSDDLVIELAASGKLTFRALDSRTREPISTKNWVALARSAGDTEFREQYAMADNAGWLSLEFREGPLELMCRPRSRVGTHQAARATVQIAPGVETRLEVLMEPGLHVQFQLDPPPDESWSDRQVFVVEPENWSAIRFQTDPNGIMHRDGGPAFPGGTIYERMLPFDSSGLAKINCLVPGKYRFKVADTEIALDPATIELTADTSEPIVLRWKP